MRDGFKSMTAFLVFWGVLSVISFTPSAPVRAQGLNIALSSDRVDITTGFNGGVVTVFGVVDDAQAPLAVILKGPERTVIMRKKNRILGAWMPTQAAEFRRVPVYYDFAITSFDLKNIPSPLRKAREMGHDDLGFYAEDSDDAARTTPFREALIRQQQQKGFYPLKPRDIDMITPRFFKATFPLPASVPTGSYTVTAIAFSDDLQGVRAEQRQTLHIGQVGFNARVYAFAHERGFFYALFIIGLAAATGWAAFTFLRRE